MGEAARTLGFVARRQPEVFALAAKIDTRGICVCDNGGFAFQHGQRESIDDRYTS